MSEYHIGFDSKLFGLRERVLLAALNVAGARQGVEVHEGTAHYTYADETADFAEDGFDMALADYHDHLRRAS